MATRVAGKAAMTGFELKCMHCAAEGAITLDLNDLSGDVTCGDCQETFSVADAVEEASESLRKWQAVARWVEMAADVVG